MHFDVVRVVTQQVNQLPNPANAASGGRLKPKNSSSRDESLRWVWQVCIEPVQNLAQSLPFVRAKSPRVQQRIGRNERTLWPVRVFVDTRGHEAEEHNGHYNGNTDRIRPRPSPNKRIKSEADPPRGRDAA